MRIIFMGSPHFAVPSLLSLLNLPDCEVAAVYTRKPQPAGRGKAITKTPIHTIAEERKIPVRTVNSLRVQTEKDFITTINPDVIVVVAYGLMIPNEVLSIPEYGCINIHPSLLPKWRGPSPIQYAILSGDKVTGVTVMKVNELLDAGPILLQKSIQIYKEDNFATLHDKLSNLGSSMLIEVLSNIHNVSAEEQDDNSASYSKKIKKCQINWNDKAELIFRQVRAFYPHAFFFLQDKRIKLLKVDYYEDNLKDLVPGTVINNNMHIKCGENSVLVPEILQLEGKKPCDIKNFLCGYQVQELTMLT